MQSHSNIAFVQRSIVLSAPTVLTIQLLRFENIHGISSKISTHVKCDERIYLRSGDGNAAVYQHRSTVAHTGLNANSGHCIVYKTFQDRYFRMSDGNYRELTQPGFKTAALLGIRAAVRAPINETPYILIYDKIGFAAHS